MTVSSENSKYLNHISVNGKKYHIYDINKLASELGFDISNLPYSIRVLLENALRNGASEKLLKSFSNWGNSSFDSSAEVNFMPARVLMQDFTGVPAVVDLAAMRDAMKKLGGDVEKVNPLIPVDLVIDHSVQVDYSGNQDSFEKNTKLEFERNIERYQFLKWGQKSFKNFKVVPPGTGICHQVNLEYLAQVVWTSDKSGSELAYPDSLVGTDSHTTMINGLGVLGWGVGGIEAEAAMLGQPLPMLIPEVIGVEFSGKLKEGITATDLVLTVTEALRKRGVVGKFVEYFGEGLKSLALADRATIANMAPEYGATCGFFPVDAETIEYLNLTARNSDRILLVEEYCKHQKLWFNDRDNIKYTDIVKINLSEISPSLAGPKRPQDRVVLENVKQSIEKEINEYEQNSENKDKRFRTSSGFDIGHGDVVIAAITSCTNTSNPYVLIAAGLVAKKAVELGLEIKPWVKASLAPGSQVVTEYLNSCGLAQYLDKLKFNLVGYGCTTCIGNSGPLAPEIEETINKNKLIVSSVLSGNRNFEGRVHPFVRANYLASPPLVVAYAIAGTTRINLNSEALGKTKDGKEVFLKDIWPSNEEVKNIVNSTISREMFESKYSKVFDGDKLWQTINISEGTNYSWDDSSTYIKNPPYFTNFSINNNPLSDIRDARILAIFGDSVTTDHISPAGNISKTSPAAKYLNEKGVENKDFNSYGARRGNHEVMMRGTFANIRIKNKILSGIEGGLTKYFPSGEQSSIFDASMKYISSSVPLVIFAGKEYGTGSSRDWAAKGTSLLGIKAVIAESFERIHRSNLVGMGVIPLSLPSNMSVDSLNLVGDEIIDIKGISDDIAPMQELICEIKRDQKVIHSLKLKSMIMTENECEYIKHGSILHNVVKELYKVN
jgi:aconitate hydratase